MARRKGQGLNAAGNLRDLMGSDHPAIPEGVKLTEAEAELWPYFARARPRDQWRELDLILLAKIVMLEVDIRRLFEEWRQTGAVIENKRGTPINNPILGAYDLLVRQQLSIIRSLSLNVQPGDPRTNVAAAIKQRTFNAVLEDDEDGLLARPS